MDNLSHQLPKLAKKKSHLNIDSNLPGANELKKCFGFWFEFQGSNSHEISIGSGHGLAPNRQQGITRTNAETAQNIVGPQWVKTA